MGEVWDAPNQQVVRADESPPWEEGDGSGGPDPVAPTVTGVLPASGPDAGGTAVRVAGTDLTAAAVTFGGQAATITDPGDGTSLSCTTPAGTAGAVDVVVTTSGGAATLAGGFTYEPAAARGAKGK